MVPALHVAALARWFAALLETPDLADRTAKAIASAGSPCPHL